ncbi:hypothetical protein [Mangrovibacterium sp.]|uniref:hypothetical protein n=1 Tax=Mangrovibacterium sp. TaxID=1961364 RepID=UPI003561E24D
MSVRFVTLFLVCFLLLGPAIQLYQQHKIRPVLVFATDNSASQKEQADICEELINRAKNELENFDIDYWAFGETARETAKNDFADSRSDYGNLLEEVQKSYLPNTVSAMVLVGDGIFNSGIDPRYSSRKVPYPIYTVGLGDTIQQSDAAILKVANNPSVFLGNYFNIEIDLMYRQLSTNSSRLSIWQEEQLVYELNLEIERDNFFTQRFVQLKAEKSGILNFRIELDHFEGEQNTANNSYEFSIQVIDQKQKILIVAHGAHPDIAAIKKVLSPQQSYEITHISNAQSHPDPADFDLVILHQLPDNNDANSPFIQKIIQSKRPVLWIIGLQTSLARINGLPLGFSFDNQRGYEYSNAVLNTDFNLFKYEKYWHDQFSNWPPLHVPFADIRLKGDWQVFADQQIHQVELSRPLIFVGRESGAKYGVFAGEGIWKWRMHDFVRNNSTEIFDGFIHKIVNYLILKPNEDNFTILTQAYLDEDQAIKFDAELLNESFEPITDPDVSLKITSNDSVSYDYVFDKSNDGYKLNIGKFPAGTYAYEANTQLGKIQYRENGLFQVNRIQLEQVDSKANFNVLYQIATASNGKFVPKENFSSLLDQLKSLAEARKQKVKQLIFKSLISLKWLAIFILFLFALEWFLRKYWGSY